MQSLLENATTIEIKNASYAVEPIPAGEFGRAAARVTKLVNGEEYDVLLQHDGLVVCSCPDFVCRHEGKGTACKHGAALLARGLLVAPATPAAGAPRPITAKDVARASYFGIKLPSIPLAPAFVAELAPAPVEVEAIEAPCPDEDLEDEGPAWTWDSWTDEDCWTITEPALAADDEAAAGVVVGWDMGESVALLMTMATLEDGDEDAFYSLDQEFRDDFFHFMIKLGCPAATWSSWLALCRSGSPVSFPGPAPIEEARPTYRGRFVPTEADDQIAALLFRDDRPGAYFVAGRPAPPIGDRSFPRRPTQPRYAGTGLTDEDVYTRPGAWS